MLSFPTGTPVHATAIVVGEAGILFTGPSGAGKSATALRCLVSARDRGLHAALVADDRTILETASGRVIASCPPALAGKAEIRGTGLVHLAFRNTACLSLVIAPGEPTGPGRLPDSGEEAAIGGIALPVVRWVYASPLDPLEILKPFGMFRRILTP